jgi:hypothetical protein
VEFHAVGRLGADMTGEDLDVLATKPLTAGKVGRADYVGRLAGMHYVCMPYGAAHYRYSPSGVLTDALALARPILAFDLPIFRDLFDRFGDIGHLCRNADEMAELIRNGFRDEQRYSGQVEAMRRARAPRLADRLKDDLRMALES